ncbi:MAG: DNA-binding transcriptional regulator Fis [Gammaproteobacteria bacterium]|jgi:Fis family transcriptional regulator|nr:DNA-binding transcriptional regulator Fis [Gammaproteobacteria bacterium]
MTISETNLHAINKANSVSTQTLRQSVEQSMQTYFEDLDGYQVTDLYDLVLQQVEAPLFASVMAYTKDNQSKAAALLGLNRGTLRKKLKQYDLL